MLLSIAALLFFPFLRIRPRLRLVLLHLQGTIGPAALDVGGSCGESTSVIS